MAGEQDGRDVSAPSGIPRHNEFGKMAAFDATTAPFRALMSKDRWRPPGRVTRSIPGREAFSGLADLSSRAGHIRVWPAHHLYVCTEDSAELHRHIGFRDYLRAQPELAKAYGELKTELAEKYKDDRAGYSEAKTDFILKVYRMIGLVADAGARGHVIPAS